MVAWRGSMAIAMAGTMGMCATLVDTRSGMEIVHAGGSVLELGSYLSASPQICRLWVYIDRTMVARGQGKTNLEPISA